MKDDFVGSNYDASSLMTVNDLHCIFNMPKALESRLHEGKEVSQGLPPYAPRKVFKVDEYNCPDSWMHGSGLASSYFVPILSEHGMWLDFNKNSQHKHHVAVLISVQGVNPVDGQSMVEGAMHLRQYKMKCPVHDVDFGGDRYCEKCGYKWVPQNYLCTTGTPNGLLWLDGFLANDGAVRQYYFTEEEVKGVAHQVIGAEKKVYSIGVAFYLSKEPKPVQPAVTRGYGGLEALGGGSPLSFGGGLKGLVSNDNYAGDGHVTWTNTANMSPKYAAQHANKSLKRTRGSGSSVVNRVGVAKSEGIPGTLSDSYTDRGGEDFDYESLKSLDIAAGAKIDQQVYADPNGLDFWQETPAGLLYINYCPNEQAVAILKKGKKPIKEDGWMQDIKVGR